MSAVAIALPEVRWDLSALFSGPEDPRIDQTWANAKQQTAKFAATYRGKINTLDLQAETLASALREIEALTQETAKPVTFAHLLFACDSGNAAIGAFMQKQMEQATALNVDLLFFELELQAAPEEVIVRISDHPSLANYRHYLQVARAFSPFRLSEKEEIILEETSNTGSRAWTRLFDEVLSNHVFHYKAPDSDELQNLSQPQIVALLRDPDRAVRQAAADVFTEGLAELQRVTTFTYNNLLQDKNVEDRLRGFKYPQQSRHMANELSEPTVELVVQLCSKHYDQVARFYRVKREILGLAELTHIDRYAPLFDTAEQVSFDEAKKIILAAFEQFCPELKVRAEEFFDRGWIDAEPRTGKRGGAFCSYATPDTHPVVFMSYLNKMDDVMTLAHELGHGAHASLSGAQTYFNFHGTLPLAELASTFGEMLVFEKITSEADIRGRLALYAEKIESVFATVFRQAAMYRFESACHKTRREHGELSADQFGSRWQAEMQEMFGDSVRLGDQHRSWWSYVGHFIHVPFYVYAYSFGELLVLALYQMAKEHGPSFADDYIAMLTMGGSKTPAELMEMVGVDLESEAFWTGGFAAMEKLITEFENLWSQFRGSGAS